MSQGAQEWRRWRLRRSRQLRRRAWQLRWRRCARDAHHNVCLVWPGGPSAVRTARRQAGLLLGLLPAAAALLASLVSGAGTIIRAAFLREEGRFCLGRIWIIVR